jgi:ABC-type Fe3+/spermidine/putrescine transport system ATPase subunit
VASVELRSLTKRYGDAAVVDDVSLTVAHGNLVCLLGPSGCGKTTTLRLIAGFIEPSAGEIRVGDRVLSSPTLTQPPERRNMSMIFQSYALWTHMTVAENIIYGLKLRKLDRATIGKKLDAILATTKLAPLAQRYPGELSGGQQQRVALARALIVEPETLLLDEPLSNLDANLREEMRFEIRRLHDAFDFTTVYVTHDQSEAMVTSDRIAVMNKGRIEQIDAPYKLYTRPQTRFVASFIGRTNLVEGTCDGADIAFDGFTLPRGIFAQEDLPERGATLLSVRPQSVKIHRSQPQAGQACVVRGELKQRAYLGESWDYIVAPTDSSLELRVAAVPSEVFEVGETIWLELDPRQMIPVI